MSPLAGAPPRTRPRSPAPSLARSLADFEADLRLPHVWVPCPPSHPPSSTPPGPVEYTHRRGLSTLGELQGVEWSGAEGHN
jgi:hypothetical protein